MTGRSVATYDFAQVDVFASGALTGNPLAVVHDADGLTEADMAAFARWTNLSETAFLLRPRDPAADYRVRIFTPSTELPFAGHPTLGSAHAWLDRGGSPAADGVVVQECGVGLVPVARRREGLAFAAPPLLRSGPVDDELLTRVVAGLGLQPGQVLDASWVDNGPGWLGVRLASARDVLQAVPDAAVLGDLAVGVIGAHDSPGPADYEVRAFVSGLGVAEDPVTGSLNAGLALWLVGAGVAPARYTVRQGTAIGRDGLVRVEARDDGTWVGGASRTVVRGTVEL